MPDPCRGPAPVHPRSGTWHVYLPFWEQKKPVIFKSHHIFHFRPPSFCVCARSESQWSTFSSCSCHVLAYMARGHTGRGRQNSNQKRKKNAILPVRRLHLHVMRYTVMARSWITSATIYHTIKSVVVQHMPKNLYVYGLVFGRCAVHC